MGLDIYLSKKTFIGAMYDSCGISGAVSLFKRGRKIPIELRRLAYVIEDVYQGRGAYWLLEWLNHELPDALANTQEREIDEAVMDRLHQACAEVLSHRTMAAVLSLARRCVSAISHRKGCSLTKR